MTLSTPQTFPPAPQAPPPAGRPRDNDKDAAILSAAAALAAEHGYLAVTLEAVAARAGVGKATLYRRWPSKAALYLETYKTLVPTVVPPLSPRPLDDLRELLRALFAAYRSTPAGAVLAGLIAEAQGCDTTARALREQVLEGRRSLITVPIQRAVALGALPTDFDIAFAAEMLVGQIWLHLLTDRSRLTGAFVDRLVESVIAGARPCPETPR